MLFAQHFADALRHPTARKPTGDRTTGQKKRPGIAVHMLDVECGKAESGQPRTQG